MAIAISPLRTMTINPCLTRLFLGDCTHISVSPSLQSLGDEKWAGLRELKLAHHRLRDFTQLRREEMHSPALDLGLVPDIETKQKRTMLSPLTALFINSRL